MFKRKKKETEYIQQSEVGEYWDPPKEEMSRRKKIILAVISVSMVLVIGFSAIFFSMFYVKKEYEYVSAFTDLPDPVQIESSGEFSQILDDYEINYEIKAEYTITGLVVEKYYYFPSSMINKISRYDLGIVWGALLGEDLKDTMKFKNKGNRFLHYTYKNSLISKLGSRDAIVNSLSNNHMIHSSDYILKCLRNVREGDYIQVKGYLVYMSYSNDNSRGTWNSSLSRTDHGDGACEIIYVTSITWLKLK